MSAVFVSDIHLCPSRPVITGLFFDFLKECLEDTDHLFILGDLFEYWVGDDSLDDPFNCSVCEALRATGIPTSIVVGNRDFLLGQRFAEASKTLLLPDECVVEVNGLRVLLLHGDTLCTDDHAYQEFRGEVRTAEWQADFLQRPLQDRLAYVENLRQISLSQKAQKAMSIMDANAQAVEAAFVKHDITHMVHGHTHRLATHTHAIDRRQCVRHVLGDWREQPNGGNYLRLHGQAWTRHVWRAKGE